MSDERFDGILRAVSWSAAGALLLALLASLAPVPYDVARAWADRFAADGDAGSFTPRIYWTLRAGLTISIGLACALSIALYRTSSVLARSLASRESPYRTLYRAAAALLLGYVASNLLFLPWTGSEDFWEHAATVRALAEPVWSHPFLPTSAPHAFATPYHLFWGRVLALVEPYASVFGVLAVAGVLNLLLKLVALYVFLHRFVDDRGKVVFLALSLLLVGIPAPHVWLHTWAYPYVARLAFALALLGLCAAFRWADGERPLGHWLALLLVGVFLLVSHPITAMFYFAGLAGVGILGLAERSGRVVLGLGLLAVAAPALASQWPLFPVVELFLGGGSAFHEANWDLMYASGWSGLLSTQWPQLLLGVPALVYLLRSGLREGARERLWLAVTILLLAAVYVAGWLLGYGTLGRARSPLHFLLNVAIAVALVDGGLGWIRSAAPSLASGATRAAHGVALMVIAITYLGLAYESDVTKAWIFGVKDGVRLSGRSDLGALEEAVEPGAVVLADLGTALKVPSYCRGHVVATVKAQAFLPAHPRRRSDVRRFFAEGTGSEAREAILARYEVDFVLVERRGHEALAEWLAVRGLREIPLGEASSHRLFRLSGSGLADRGGRPRPGSGTRRSRGCCGASRAGAVIP